MDVLSFLLATYLGVEFIFLWEWKSWSNNVIKLHPQRYYIEMLLSSIMQKNADCVEGRPYSNTEKWKKQDVNPLKILPGLPSPSSVLQTFGPQLSEGQLHSFRFLECISFRAFTQASPACFTFSPLCPVVSSLILNVTSSEKPSLISLTRLGLSVSIAAWKFPP